MTKRTGSAEHPFSRPDRVCRTCKAASLEFSRRVCDACRDARLRANQRKAWRLQDAKRKIGKPKNTDIIQCKRCLCSMARRNSNRLFCDTCKPVHNKEMQRSRTAEKRRALGLRAAGDTVPCRFCEVPMVLHNAQREFCDECVSRHASALLNMKRRRRSDPKFIVRSALNTSIHKALRAKRSKKGGRMCTAILGYPIDDLRWHLEKQFLPGMTWENHSREGWHIDHIVPLRCFNFTGPDDPELRAAYALSNLRPLWAKDNLSKQGRRLLLC